MDPRQISCLARLLRENGDKVLNSEYKLTLTGAILRALNDSFSLIVDPNEVCTPQTFQVLKPNNAKSEVFRELQFIYDFVQKAQILCLTTTIPNDDPFDGLIDISKFRSLRRLEIQRIPIEQIVGIQRLRAHLQEIICSKSIRSVQDIISHCGGDKSNGFLWNSLIKADFSYNQLKTIDCSMEFASNLQQLNLSHNQIVSVDAIKWLPNLKKLNLSYNSLTHIPTCIASRRLQTLILTNNFIEDLGGLSRLDALSELNLSDNCILDHSALVPLSTLIALQYLHLHGNPISCHPNHREETAKYLHKNTASVNFILDFRPLSSYEKSLIGHYQTFNAVWGSRLAKAPHRSSGLSTPSRQTKENTPTSSIGSLHSFQLAGSSSSLCGNGDSTIGYNDSLNTSQTSLRKIRVRPAIIADDDSNDEFEVVRVKPKKKKTPLKVEVPTVFREHLETKKQIEELRKEYGDDWLHSQGATKVQNVMGIPSSMPKSSGIFGIKSPTQTTEQLIDNLFRDEDHDDEDNSGQTTIKKEQQRTSTPISKNRSIADVVESTISGSSEYKSVVGSEQDSQTATGSSMFQSTIDDDPLYKLYESSANEPDPVSDAEDNETIYLICDEPHKNDLLLIVSDQSLREKDALTTRTVTRWNMTLLESCERIKVDVLRLRFDTVKRDKKERTYHLEEGQGQNLENFLRNILSNRPLSEMNQTVFRCVNCSTQFSRENLARNIEVKCPECNSTYVVEIKESSPPRPSKQHEKSLEKSASHSSIAPAKMAWEASSNNLLTLNNAKVHSKRSASSFNESTNISKISHSQSSFDSNQSLIGSTTNCDQTTDLDMYFASRYGAHADSDVEILSNPSISSIEVLDNFSRQSSRKHSEDRHIHPSVYLQNQSNGAVSLYKSVDASIQSSTNNSDVEEITGEPQNDLDHRHRAADGNETHGTSKHVKKPILTGMNLTESSSSGSVTDSVCTAYENQATDTKTSMEGMSRSTIAEAGENDELASNKTEDVSTLSSMLGGLFYSTNMLMSRNDKSSSSPKESALCDEFRFSYSNFDNVDHRLKLFLYQNIFDDDNEHLKWLVKGRIYNDTVSTASVDAIDGRLQPAIFVMSTTKWYILHIVGHESEDIGKWLKRQLFGTIDRVEMVRVLPWKIGVTFTLKFIGNVHFLLQDIMRTDSLLLFFANNPLPCYCSLEYQISERLSQKLLHITNNVQLKMLAILNRCKITCDNRRETHDFVSIIITETNLYLTSDNYGWLADRSEENIGLTNTQLITNIVGVDPIDDCTFLINFLDEIENRDEMWKCRFETKSSLDSTFNAIAQSWEKLFQVPLAN